MIAKQIRIGHELFTSSVPLRKRRVRSRQKFLVTKEAQVSCQSPDHSELEWYTYEENSRHSLFASYESPNSVDELFQQAAEKVGNQIVINRKIYGGAPCVANTRVPVYVILQMVEDGCTHKQILKAFPSIGQEGLKAALRFSVLVMER